MWNQYSNIPISALLLYWGQKHDIGVDILPAVPPPPAGRMATAQALQPLQPLGPLPAGLSEHNGGSAHTFPAALHARLRVSARNVEFHRPTSGKKGVTNASVAMEVAADKPIENHWLGHGCQVLKVTGSRVALAEQEDDGSDEGDLEHCQNGNILDISTQAYSAHQKQEVKLSHHGCPGP